MVRRGAAGRPAGRLRLLLVLGLASGSEASCDGDPGTGPQFADKEALSAAIATYMADPDNYQYLGPCTWDVHLVTDFSQLLHCGTPGDCGNKDAFGAANRPNDDIDSWDTARGTSFTAMFKNSRFFQFDLNSWDMSKATKIDEMFHGAQMVFNGDISSWDTSKVSDAKMMFKENRMYNGALGGWDTSRFVWVNGMFEHAERFESTTDSISSWDTSNVQYIYDMFKGARLFNGDISKWDVSKVGYQGLQNMFYDACRFNADIGTWDVARSLSFDNTFYKSTSSAGDSWSSCMGNVADEPLWSYYEGNKDNDCDGTAVFQGDLKDWDVAQATSFVSTFFCMGAGDNLDLSKWDVSRARVLQSTVRSRARRRPTPPRIRLPPTPLPLPRAV
jgi:hypothetical protein